MAIGMKGASDHFQFEKVGQDGKWDTIFHHFG
jgi:hypothetical protein